MEIETYFGGNLTSIKNILPNFLSEDVYLIFSVTFAGTGVAYTGTFKNLTTGQTTTGYLETLQDRAIHSREMFFETNMEIHAQDEIHFHITSPGGPFTAVFTDNQQLDTSLMVDYNYQQYDVVYTKNVPDSEVSYQAGDYYLNNVLVEKPPRARLSFLTEITATMDWYQFFNDVHAPNIKIFRYGADVLGAPGASGVMLFPPEIYNPGLQTLTIPVREAGNSEQPGIASFNLSAISVFPYRNAAFMGIRGTVQITAKYLVPK